MYRKLIKDLVKWKDNPGRRPLILEGARQVGKTYLLETVFGRECFDNVVKVNLQNPSDELVELFEGSIVPSRIIENLELMFNVKIEPGKTLLFFDEIQDVPRALTSLKYFCEEAPEYHIVAAGSLLGVFLKKEDDEKRKAPFPVGKVDRLTLEPLDFEEFLIAKDMGRFVEKLRQEPELTLFDEQLRDSFREYLVVGGMPRAVSSWIEKHDIEELEWIQNSILDDYRDDFKKYTDANMTVKISEVFETLPAQFAKGNDKFVYGTVKESARGREYEQAIFWLVNSGIVRRVFNVDSGIRMPLTAYINRDAFKLYFLDIGLFRVLAKIPSSLIYQKNAVFDEFNGLIAEQFVLQQLGGSATICYWTGAKSEVDFVLQNGARIIPIEVKSGENVHAQSLKFYREKYQPELSLRLSMKDFEVNNGLLNLPLYKSFLLGDLLKKY